MSVPLGHFLPSVLFFSEWRVLAYLTSWGVVLPYLCSAMSVPFLVLQHVICSMRCLDLYAVLKMWVHSNNFAVAKEFSISHSFPNKAVDLWIVIDHLVWSVLTRSPGCASWGSLDDLLLGIAPGCQHVLHGSRAEPAPCSSYCTHVPWRDAVSLQRLKGTGMLQPAHSTGGVTQRRNIFKDQRGILCWLVAWKGYVQEHQCSQKCLVQVTLSKKNHL